MQHKTLQDIAFPIFGITSNYKRIYREYGVLYIETTKDFVLDNRNIEGATLGKRRARIKSSKLYIPRISIFNVPQLLNTKYSVFIDNNGMVFTYKKHTFVPLTYHKVKELIKYENNCVLKFKDTTYMMQVNYSDAYGIQFVGLLHTQLGDIVYEITDEHKANTRKKI